MAEEGDKLYAHIDYEDTYVQPLLLAAIKAQLPIDLLVFIKDKAELPSPDSKFLQWKQYESIDFEYADWKPRNNLINSYIFRKALIRKHYLSATVEHWLAKHPDSILKDHVKQSTNFEVDYAEFLDDALVDAFDLNESLQRNEEVEGHDRQWWILKPGMSDRGQGIRLFSTMDQLTAIFEGWEADMPESDDEDEARHSDTDGQADTSDGIITSQLRHFIAQPYINPPLLFDGAFESAKRKFHIRTYVVAAGPLKVFVYKPMLALFASGVYASPQSSESTELNEALGCHLTNTCLQTGEREGSVHPFWNLPDDVSHLSRDWKERVFEQICKVTGELFEAAARGMMVHFQPLPHAFEIYGVDFMVDAEGTAWLLEVNAFPDFAQTGGELQDLIANLFGQTIKCIVRPYFESSSGQEGVVATDLIKVLDVDLGSR